MQTLWCSQEVLLARTPGSWKPGLKAQKYSTAAMPLVDFSWLGGIPSWRHRRVEARNDKTKYTLRFPSRPGVVFNNIWPEDRSGCRKALRNGRPASGRQAWGGADSRREDRGCARRKQGSWWLS